jgi:hypothetical protein
MDVKNQVWNWTVDSIKLKDLGGVPMEIETKGSIKLQKYMESRLKAHFKSYNWTTLLSTFYL